MSQKLFVIIDRTLPNEHRAVQGGHAVAQFLIDHPDTEWNNGTLVYLGVPNSMKLLRLKAELSLKRKPVSFFEETDWGTSPRLTAVATTFELPSIKRLKLLGA